MRARGLAALGEMFGAGAFRPAQAATVALAAAIMGHAGQALVSEDAVSAELQPQPADLALVRRRAGVG